MHNHKACFPARKTNIAKSTTYRRQNGTIYSEDITHQAKETLQRPTDEYNTIGEELAQAQRDLFDWGEWYQEGFPPQTQAEEGGLGPEEIKEFFASLNQDEPQGSPLTPAVQQDVLSTHHLPPTTLPSFGTGMPGNLSSDSSTHLRSAKAPRTDHDTDLSAEFHKVLGICNLFLRRQYFCRVFSRITAIVTPDNWNCSPLPLQNNKFLHWAIPRVRLGLPKEIQKNSRTLSFLSLLFFIKKGKPPEKQGFLSLPNP